MDHCHATFLISFLRESYTKYSQIRLRLIGREQAVNLSTCLGFLIVHVRKTHLSDSYLSMFNCMYYHF